MLHNIVMAIVPVEEQPMLNPRDAWNVYVSEAGSVDEAYDIIASLYLSCVITQDSVESLRADVAAQAEMF